MKLSVFISTRALLLTCNFMLMSCGILLVISGFLLLCDWPRVLLSRLVLPIVGTQALPQPPFYYAALILLGTGLIICSAAVLGCWSACVFNYCILTIAFLLVIFLFLSECIIYGMIWLWPGCIGLSVSPTYLARTLQRTYGKPGFEQYTAAMDFAQTNLKCCGISSSAEYNGSLWKLQKLSQPLLSLPLSCCVINNLQDPNAYMKPSPINITKCQAWGNQLSAGFRHDEGCIKKLQNWFRHQYTIFLILGLIVVLVEFFVLLGILLACTRVNKYRGHHADHPVCSIGRGDDSINRKITENIYENERPCSRFRSNNDAYTLSRSFRQNYRINHNDNCKP